MKAPQIFLSYVRENEHEVKGLYRKLAEAGFNPWMDKKNLLPGKNWKHSIMLALRRSDFILLCLSSIAVKKRSFFWMEVRQALELLREKLEDDIYVIPVRLDDCELPQELSELQWADIFEESGWQQLVRAIQTQTEAARLTALAGDEDKKGAEPGMEIDDEGADEVDEAFRPQVWELIVPEQISITTPSDGSNVAWRDYVSGTVTNPDALVKLVIRPMDESSYWIQPAVSVRKNGDWKARGFFGRAGRMDKKKGFEILAVANPKDNLTEGMVLGKWPEAEWKSQVIEVFRK